MGRQGMDEVSRRLDWKTKSSLRLDCRTMAGLYTGGTVPILTKRTMGSVANDIAQWELRIIGNWNNGKRDNRLLGKSHSRESLERTRLLRNRGRK